MKKLLLLLILAVGAMAVHAEEFAYLIFETNDGAKVAVDVSALTMTTDGSILTAGSKTFDLPNLNKMYFSTTDETTMTGIDQLTIDNQDQTCETYDLQGRKVSPERMTNGIFIIKTKQGTRKVLVQ